MYAYNTRKKSFRQLERTLVGDDRWEILDSILKELTIKKGEAPKQHWMLVGPRGIGKSHLLTLLYYRIRENSCLRNLWIPILFPEELRMVSSLSRFLERTVNEIILELEQEKNKITDELKQKIVSIKKASISERADNFFSLISWIHKKTGKFTVLITENLQQLLGKKIPVIEQKKLRAFLQTSDALLVVGSATNIFKALHDHSHPFYHFFHIRRMEDLEFKDMKILVAELIAESGSSELTKKTIIEDARLKTIYAFTGGNPRMAVFLSDILKAQVSDEMLHIMEIILDELTPHFEAILKEVPVYLEDIINALASFEPAQSPKEISHHLEAPQTTIRNYLKQLKESGYVRVAFSKGKSNYYCLNEYLYRIWYQMRDSSHWEETRWIMQILLMLYSPSTIVKKRRKIEADFKEERSSSSYETLIVQTADFMSHNPAYCKIIELYMDSTISSGKKIMLDTKEKKLLQKAYNYADNNQYDKAIRIYKSILKNNPNFYPIHRIIGSSYRNLGQHSEAIQHFKKAIKLNPKYDSAYLEWSACLVDIERFDEAIEMLRKTIKLNPKSDKAYWYWGVCLIFQKRYEDAIEKLKAATKINSNFIDAYFLWGECLYEQGNYEEAIRLFEKYFPENKDNDVLYYYGRSLMKVGRYEEALKQFELIIKHDSEYYKVYLYYGQLMEKMKNFEFALIAYLKHIRSGYFVSSADFDFQKIYDKYIFPLTDKLKPGNYIEHFYLSKKKRKFSKPQLSIILILFSQYDTVSEHFNDIININSAKSDKEKEDFSLLIFTLKLSIQSKVSEGDIHDALRLMDLYIEYIKYLDKTSHKEKEVSDFCLSLLKNQIKSDIDSESIKEILQKFEDQEEVPFSIIFSKVWICLNEPESVNAQRFLNEKPIAEVVRELKK